MDSKKRNGEYKMRSLKYANAKDARALRIDEQNDNRGKARDAKRNANRGLVEITNTNIEAVAQKKICPAELTQQQKLQERLQKLKIWREQKIVTQEKEKAKKKAPFVVPCVTRSEKQVSEATVKLNKTIGQTDRVTRSKAAANSKQKEFKAGPTKPSERATHSQAKAAPAKSIEKPISKTLQNKTKKISSQKWEVKSFAPQDFQFTAPQGTRCFF